MIVKINGEALALASVQARPTDFYTSLSNIGDFFVATKDFFVSIGEFFIWIGEGIANIKELGFFKWSVGKIVAVSDIALLVALISCIFFIFGAKKSKTVIYWSIVIYLLIQILGMVVLV